MRKNRTGLVYFSILGLAGLVGLLAANRTEERLSEQTLDGFEPPQMSLELPFELPFEIPYGQIQYKARILPRLFVTGDVETVLAKNRQRLLESAEAVVVRNPKGRAETTEIDSSSRVPARTPVESWVASIE